MSLKRLAFLILLFAGSAFGQGIRFGDTSSVVSVQTPAGFISVVPNAGISFCNSPANATPCTNKATTYTSITLATACPTSTQIVLSGTNTCVGTTDAYGNWGVWVAAGTYTYTVQLPTGGYMGPYTVTLAGGGGGGGVPPAGLLAGQFSNAAGTQFGNATCPLGTFSVDSVTSTTYISDPCNTFFASGVPYYDVQSPVFGAKCDGVTDDTAAITAAVNAMNANLTGNSSPGVIYFSRSANPCKFNGNVFAGPTSINSKYILSDNSFLLTGSVTLAVNAQNWTFIQRVGAPQGLTPVSNWASYGTWATTGNFPALDLGEPAYGLWFEGINFIGYVNAGATAPPVHLHDNCTGGVNVPVGCGAGAFITFSKSHFLPATANQVPFLEDSSSNSVPSWYSVKIDNSTFQTQGTQAYALKFINGGQLSIRDTNFAGTGGILAQNNGVSITGDITIDNVAVENMIATANADFLTVSDGGGANSNFLFWIKDLKLQDTTGNIYVFKAIDTASGDVANVNIENCADGQCGAGLIDPASSAFTGFRCSGNGSGNNCSAQFLNKSLTTDMKLFPANGRGIYSYTSNYSPSITADGGFATDLQTISANQTLSYAHTWYNITGTTTITIPQLPNTTGMPQNQWHLFNSGSNTVTVQCSSGNINGSATVTMAAKTGGVATSDGSNCFLDSGAGSGGGGGFANPMTTLGDMIVENSVPTPARLGGNTTTTTASLCQTGNGTISALPSWCSSVGAGTSPVYATVTSPAQGQVLVYNASNVLVNSYAGVPIDQYTGAASLSCPLDRLGRIEFNITVARTLSIPQAGSTACLGSNIAFLVANMITSTGVLSVTATTSTFQPEGISTYTLLPGESLFVYSDATTSTGNYHVTKVAVGFGAVGNNNTAVTSSYTAAVGDAHRVIPTNCAGACTITLPAAPYNQYWTTEILPIGGTLPTILLSGTNFNGSATPPVLILGQALTVFTDGTNYFGSVPTSGSGSGTVGSCATTNAIAQYTAATTTGCGNADFTIDATAHTLKGGASGLVDFSALSVTAGFKVPSAAGAIPTADGFLAFNTTIHALVLGENGNTAVEAVAGLGTSVSTTCGAHNWVSTVSGVAAPSCTQPGFGDLTGNPTLQQQCTGCTQAITSAYTNASSALTNVTGLSFSALANTNYRYTCDLYYEGSASTAGLQISFTGPSAPTTVSYSASQNTGTGSSIVGTAVTGSTFPGTAVPVSAGSSPTAVYQPSHIALTLINGANAGTVQLQAQNSGAGTVTIAAGSSCHVDVIQ